MGVIIPWEHLSSLAIKPAWAGIGRLTGREVPSLGAGAFLPYLLSLLSRQDLRQPRGAASLTAQGERCDMPGPARFE